MTWRFPLKFDCVWQYAALHYKDQHVSQGNGVSEDCWLICHTCRVYSTHSAVLMRCHAGMQTFVPRVVRFVVIVNLKWCYHRLPLSNLHIMSILYYVECGYWLTFAVPQCILLCVFQFRRHILAAVLQIIIMETKTKSSCEYWAKPTTQITVNELRVCLMWTLASLVCLFTEDSKKGSAG